MFSETLENVPTNQPEVRQVTDLDSS